jgi:RND family efflux transporter MFP subunit
MPEPSPRPDLSALRIPRDEPRPTRRGRSRRRGWLLVALLLVALVVVVGLLSRGSAVKVATGSVESLVPASTRSTLTATGYVVAQRKASVASKATGRLETLLVEEGDRVKTGQVLARLEADDVTASLNAARAAANQAEAGLASANALAKQATLAFERAQGLLAQKLLAQSDYDRAEAQHATALAGVAAAEAAIATARANADLAAVQVENTYIRAPFDGTVLTKDADVGEVVAPFASSPSSRGSVLTLADMGSLEVEADVAESNIRQVRTGQPCLITLDALPTEPYRGRLNKIIPTADRAKATVLTRIAFERLDERVLPEMSAKVSFLAEGADSGAASTRAILAAPAAAVVERGGRSVVFVVRRDRATRVAVETGARYGDLFEIRSGLAGGEIVVLDPPERLRDGGRVKIQ